MLLLLLISFAFAEIIWDLPGIEEKQWKIASRELQGQITVPFGGVVGRGFLPAYVEIQNVSSAEQEIKIEFEYSGSRNSIVKQEFTLSPGAEKEVQLLIPAIQKTHSSLYMTVHANNELQVNYSDQYLSFAPSGFAYGEYGVPRLLIANTESHDEYPEWFAASKMASQSSGIKSAHYLADSKWLPIESVGYTSQHSVIWFVDQVDLENNKAQALANWVLGGGHLVIVSREKKFENYNSFTDWIEERFADPNTKHSSERRTQFSSSLSELSSREEKLYGQHMKLKLGSDAVLKYQMGLGSLTMVTDNISLEKAYLLQMASSWNKTLLYESYDSSGNYNNGIFDRNHVDSLSTSWDELELTPSWVIVFLTYAFALIIGPMNLMWALKRKRIFILYSTPVISIVCVGVVFLISMLLETKMVRGLTTDITVLDQRNQNLISSEHRLFFLSKNLQEGLYPTPGNHLLPISDVGQSDFYLEIDGEVQTYRRYAKSREIQAHWGWHDLSSRLKLQFSGAEVTNALGIDIDVLFYADQEGQLWYGKEIGKGEKVSLESISTLPKSNKYWSNMVLNYRFIGFDTLPPNTYLLRSKDNQFGYHDIISQRISQHDHVIYGVLP